MRVHLTELQIRSRLRIPGKADPQVDRLAKQLASLLADMHRNIRDLERRIEKLEPGRGLTPR